ncbi:hypothetical protein ACX9R5_08890 [Rathayibacter sp. CAU 1779]
MTNTTGQTSASLVALQDAIETVYRGSVYGFERTADGFTVAVEPSALAGNPPLTSGLRRSFRFRVIADPATSTYRLKVTTFGVGWQLPGASESSVMIVQRMDSMKISAKLQGTDLAGGIGSQRFEYDTLTDSSRIEAAAASVGWTRRKRGIGLGALLGIIFGGIVVVLGVVFGILFGSGVL